MATPIKPPYNETLELEFIYDFQNTQIFRTNTKNTNLFITDGKKFDAECLRRVDDQGRLRCIFIVDTPPPLSAILKFVSSPFDKVKWGIYAVIIPDQSIKLASKFAPILVYGLSITPMRDQFIIKVFDHSHRDDLTQVLKWMDESMTVKAEGSVDYGVLKDEIRF